MDNIQTIKLDYKNINSYKIKLLQSLSNVRNSPESYKIINPYKRAA